MDVARQSKVAVKTGLDKSGKKSKNKKKRSSKKRNEKENDKVGSSPDAFSSDQEITGLQESDTATQRSEASKDTSKDTCTQLGTRSTNISTVKKLLTTSQTSQIYNQAGGIQLQLQTQGYGEAVKVNPTKKDKPLQQTQNPVTVAKSKSAYNARPTKTDLKHSASQQSFMSSKSSKTSISSVGTLSRSTAKPDINNESLRWENMRSDSDEEEERINKYKLNRRKRYLAASNKKYSDWLKTLSCENIASASSGSPRKDVTGAFQSKTGSFNGLSQKDEFVSGLGPTINLSNSNSQVLLNS